MWGSTSTALSSAALWTLLFLVSRFGEIAASQAQTFLPQGFFFDWNPPGTTVPIPVTQQCETLHITWQRGSTATGPNPTSPYSLQIFTSTFVVPITVPAGDGTSLDFQVPFAPGTQYQICMWAAGGVSGGCQGIYTVIPNTTATAQNPATCKNVTYPATALSVDAAVVNGAFSQYGWVPQCTDIRVKPQNGTGPYTFTVAPALHPPLNITSNGDAMNWTVSFSHGLPFFVSVVDSQGNGWAQGPLHSGDGPDTSCLDLNRSSSGSSSHVGTTIGAAVGGVVVGLLAGAFGLLAFVRCRRPRNRQESREDLTRDNHLAVHPPQSARATSVNSGRSPLSAGGNGLEYIVEPFAMPSPPSDAGAPLLGSQQSPTTQPADATSSSGLTDPADQNARRQNVYVVHHDGGRAPVTVYTEAGAEVVELPPRYANSTSSPSAPSAASESDASREVNRRRDPKATPRKGTRAARP